MLISFSSASKTDVQDVPLLECPIHASLSFGRSPHCRADAPLLTGLPCPPFLPALTGEGGRRCSSPFWRRPKPPEPGGGGQACPSDGAASATCGGKRGTRAGGGCGDPVMERAVAMQRARGLLAPAPPEESPQEALSALRLRTATTNHSSPSSSGSSVPPPALVGSTSCSIRAPPSASSALILPACSNSSSPRRKAPLPSARRHPTPPACCRRLRSFTWPSARPSRFAR